MKRDQRFTLWFTDDEHAGLKRLAYAEGLSMSAALRRLLILALRDHVGVSENAQVVMLSERGMIELPGEGPLYPGKVFDEKGPQ